MPLARFNLWYKKYEKHFASAALIGGFLFDVFTLRRADTLWENSWIILHLLITATTIVLLSRREPAPDGGDSRLDFWLLGLMQFSFGGLLSAFLILYFRSASLGASWPFLLILAAAFIANERLKGYRERLIFQISFFYLSLLSFFIYFVPVLVGSIGPFIFLISGVISLLVMRLFLRILRRVSRGNLDVSRKSFRKAVLAIFVVMNVLYFANIIPPIPMSLREAGIYHSLSRATDGSYILGAEKKGFLDHFRFREKLHVMEGKSLYAYTAVFSPARFDTDIVHEWQKYDESIREWVTVTRVSLPTFGGRYEGFRTYSGSETGEGVWRVNVTTERGLVLGRIGFSVERAEADPPIETRIR